MNVDVSINFETVYDGILNKVPNIVLQGSTRSCKTFDTLKAIVTYCTKNTGKIILCTRETYGIAKVQLFDTLVNILSDWSIKYKTRGQEIMFNGNVIYCWGADNHTKLKGFKSDLILMDEANETNKKVYNQLRMRCNGTMILTKNPSYLKDWVDNIARSKHTITTHSTFEDNPLLTNQERQNILAYEPTKENIDNGTADAYNWSVYGLGQSYALQGTVFSYKLFDELPPTANFIAYGLDFGFRDQMAMSKIYLDGRNIYIYDIYYESESTIATLDYYLKESNTAQKNEIIIADSSSPTHIADMQNMGYRVVSAYKPQGSILNGIKLMKKYNLFVHSQSKDLQLELNSYIWKTTTKGVALNTPIDSYNHLIDGIRYVLLQYFYDNL